jgi:glycosyltransferase involved in cell wall biosynthesis
VAVSVVIPVYRAQGYVGAAIESVLNQTYADFELLILDNGSDDGTLAIVASYAERDARIRFRTRPNAGAVRSINDLIQWARHDLVAVMHADDVMEPQRLERQVAFLEQHPEVAVATSYVHYIGPDGRRIGAYRSPFTDPAAVWREFEAGRAIGLTHPSAMMRRADVLAVGGYREAFTVTDDADLWMRLLEAGRLVLVQPEFLLSYRVHSGSASVRKSLRMCHETRWVGACSTARRRGLAEPTFEQFKALEAQDPWRIRMARFAEERAQVYYKAAVDAYASRDLPRTAWALAISSFWYPGRALRLAWLKRG